MNDPTNDFLYPIRPCARAVIWRGDELLVQLKTRPGQARYLTLPGGKQDPGETLQDCVMRECLEEIGAEVSVGPLLHVAEVFKPKTEGTRHQLEFLFSCALPDDYTPVVGPHPDPSQIDTVWTSPKTQAGCFRPAYGAALLNRAAPYYLGVFDG